MTKIHPQCENLASQVNQILELVEKNPDLRVHQETSKLETSLQKAIAPKFEIVFAGAFSAGKSMLINGLLGRELLYSAEGHATGIECYIEYAEPNQERVVLTFLSESEILEQILTLAKHLNINLTDIYVNQIHVIEQIKLQCEQIINQEGGVNKSEKAKQANALKLLLEGFEDNKEKIHPTINATYSMEQFNFNNLTEAATYARRGKNSAVLKRLDYYCNHPLLEDGNVLVDLPGIDAPIEKDRELAFNKIEDSNTSVVVCVLKPASAGDLTQAETDLLEKIKSNSSIRDRVFYVFNRIDQTWYNGQLRERLDSLINSDFNHTNRVYKTSGLLGFYGSQIKQTSFSNRFGLDSIFADSIKGLGGEEETPQFISEFNNYCANSGKLITTNFKVSVNGYETPNQNYLRILSEWGMPLIDQLIKDSGIDNFKQEITRYLIEEKRPQLFANLADDLSPICIALKKIYQQSQQELNSQPQEIEAMKQQELNRLNLELQDIGNNFYEYINEQVNLTVTSENKAFNQDFQRLQTRFVNHLDELLKTFSVSDTYSRAVKAHPRNQTAPLIAVLVEALYYLSNSLEDVLIEELKDLVNNFINDLVFDVRLQDFYRQLYRLLGNDGGIENDLSELESQLFYALKTAATTECDRYVRETPQFYSEGTFSIYQFRETLKQTAQSYDVNAMIDAEPAIRQLLKLDFEPKVNRTIREVFLQTINQTIKTNLLPLAEKMKENILEKHDLARENLQQTLEEEAREKIAYNQQLMTEIKEDAQSYNKAVSNINNCLEAMEVYERKLPLITIQE
ncbi:dynamin-like GTPase family protein [Geminocystis sp. GBBB08]|uniref:dynamin-like GTPase family protein n=1 Tax=Geminocystis sp. GBBB08 TaxID=2604140 RepID=UPI0027E2BCC0|nr:dynamin-like GTPase family protein [Geminocystis sp. GBBB08]MBL1210894.1 dynamin family protein [Geminocystis sp. GBBB08]